MIELKDDDFDNFISACSGNWKPDKALLEALEETRAYLDSVVPPKDWPSFIGNVSEEWLEEINGKA